MRSAKSRNGRRRSSSSRIRLRSYGRQPVPFVGHDDQRAAAFEHQSEQADVLLGHAVVCIQHGDHDLRLLDGLQRLDDAEFLDRLVHARLAANAGRIDQQVLAIVALERHGDAVPRRAGLIEDDEPLFAQQSIRERRFANVGSTDDGDAQLFVVVIPGLRRCPRDRRARARLPSRRRYDRRVPPISRSARRVPGHETRRSRYPHPGLPPC